MSSSKNAFRRLLGSAAVSAAPAVLVVLALYLLGYLPLGVAVVAGVVLALGTVFTYHACREDLEDLWHYATSLSEGKEKPSVPPVRTLAGRNLANFLVQQDRDLSAEREASGDKGRMLQNVLDTLPDPILMIDGERRVTRINRAARELFQVDNELVGNDLALTLRHPGTLAVVDDILAGRESAKDLELTLPGPISRHLTARIAGLASRSNDGTTVVLSLHDLTAATRAEQMRADFVANVSHELRTPLSALFGFIETLQGPARNDPAAQERFLAIMGGQADRMARLIDDLLSLSHIELDEHTIPTGRVALPAVMSSVAAMVEPKAKERNVRIKVEKGAGIPEVAGETDQLIQVFENLVTNAVKYGRQNGEVRVNYRLPEDPGGRKGKIGVSVQDQGEGMAREHLPRLTERFYRVDSARSRALGGTGLGLAIVKHIVNRHRGLLVVESEVGKGSTFTVYLPVAVGEEPEKA